MEETISLTETGSNSSGKEATKQDSSIVKILATNCCTLEPFKHTGGKNLEPEMLDHVLMLLNWKHFVFHRGCSFNLKSILKAGLIQEGEKVVKPDTTVFFTPLNHGVPEKKKNSMKPREGHYET